MEKQESHEKHSKYYNSYIPNDFFWGIGIENETYLEIPDFLDVSGNFFKNQKRERYSVNYYETYKDNSFNDKFDTLTSLNSILS